MAEIVGFKKKSSITIYEFTCRKCGTIFREFNNNFKTFIKCPICGNDEYYGDGIRIGLNSNWPPTITYCSKNCVNCNLNCEYRKNYDDNIEN